MKKTLPSLGPWAIITGASAGIGAGFARRLAAEGLNLVLVARRAPLLESLAAELRASHGVEVRAHPADLSEPDAAEALATATADLDVGLLVANAGAARMGAFLKVGLRELAAMARLNVTTQLALAHHFATRFAARPQGGGLLLVSSTVAYQGIPYAANYSGAKAYLLNLGEALNHELRGSGVHVTVLVPGPTDTPGLTGRDDANMVEHLPMRPQPVPALVREGLAALLANEPSHIGGRVNRTMTRVMNAVLPRNTAVSFWGTQMQKMVHDK